MKRISPVLAVLLLLTVSEISAFQGHGSGSLKRGEGGPAIQQYNELKAFMFLPGGAGRYFLQPGQGEKEIPKETKNVRNEDNKTIRDRIDDIKDKIGEASGADISGFFDMTASNYRNNPNTFNFGDWEFDVERNFADFFQVAGALVINDEGIELAVAFVDIHPVGNSISPRGRLFEEEGYHLQVGKYDVPFGNDWLYYASADRITVTAPLTTDYVIDGGYNDVGIRTLVTMLSFNATLFVIRGIDRGITFGGRVGFTPFNNPYTLQEMALPLFEIGFSHMHDANRNWNVDERIYSIDFESKIAFFHLRGEYYLRDIKERQEFDEEAAALVDINREIKDGYQIFWGFHFEDLLPLETILFFRYDMFRSRHNSPSSMFATSGNLADRISTGFNIDVFEVFKLKFEYNWHLRTYADYRESVNESYSNQSFWIQLVVIF